MSGKSWINQEDEKLIRLVKEGKTLEEITNLFSRRSKGAIEIRIKRLSSLCQFVQNEKNNNEIWLEAEDDKLIQLMLEGKSLEEIGIILSKSEASIKKKLERYSNLCNSVSDKKSLPDIEKYIDVKFFRDVLWGIDPVYPTRMNQNSPWNNSIIKADIMEFLKKNRSSINIHKRQAELNGNYFLVEDFATFSPVNDASSMNKNKLTYLREINYLTGHLLNHGLPNTREEIQAIRNEYENGSSLDALETYFQRTQRSIKNRLNS